MTPLPTSTDRMPREGEKLSPEFVIALALGTVPYRWSGRLLEETSPPVRAVMTALEKAGYRIVPAE